MFQTSILLLIYNRPDTTLRVFESIRKQKPKKLFISADGPRVDRKSDRELCETARSISKLVDWDCDIYTNYSEKNLGCRKAVSSGITWFFDHVDQGIILEDDCLPNDSFFGFMELMLEKYRDDKRIMMVSGCNQMTKWNTNDCSYFFSQTGSVWGWASWKRAWAMYDNKVSELTDLIEKNLFKDFFLYNPREAKIKQKLFWKTFHNEIESWGYVWDFCRMKNNALSIVPSLNLIENLGYSEGATHSTDSSILPQSFFDSFHIDLSNIQHPGVMYQDYKYDKLIFNELHFPSRLTKLKYLLKNGLFLKFLNKKFRLSER